MKIINLFKLNENAEVLNKDKEKTQLHLPQGFPDDYLQKDTDIAGEWLILDELLKVNNSNLIYFKDKDKARTWIKLPTNYVKENYLINYESDDICPEGIDVLVKENGYPIGVVSGCKSVTKVKITNHLDGHKYNGVLGIKINNDYFINYDKKAEKFDIIKTNKDWDRGKNTI